MKSLLLCVVMLAGSAIGQSNAVQINCTWGGLGGCSSPAPKPAKPGDRYITEMPGKLICSGTCNDKGCRSDCLSDKPAKRCAWGMQPSFAIVGPKTLLLEIIKKPADAFPKPTKGLAHCRAAKDPAAANLGIVECEDSWVEPSLYEPWSSIFRIENRCIYERAIELFGEDRVSYEEHSRVRDISGSQMCDGADEFLGLGEKGQPQCVTIGGRKRVLVDSEVVYEEK